MLKIRIETKNDAFRVDAFRGDDMNLEKELIECLKRVIERISLGFEEGPILDSYGNKVGTFKLTKR